MTNKQFSETPYASIFPYAFTNVLAFVLEYFHSDFTPTIDQIYETPGDNIESDGELGVLMDDNEIVENSKKKKSPKEMNEQSDDDSPSAQGENSTEL